MIAASNIQEFVPYGRHLMNEYSTLTGQQSTLDKQAEYVLLNKLSRVAITEQEACQESWILTNTEDGQCVEELYFRGKTVIWSVGPLAVDHLTNRVLKCSYTNEKPIQTALWCNFHLAVPDFNTTFFSNVPQSKTQTFSTDIDDTQFLKKCICVVEETSMRFYTSSGQEYVTPLQFEVLKVWPIKYGLILERKIEAKDLMDAATATTKKKSTGLIGGLRRQSLEASFFKNSFGSTQYLGLPTMDMPTLPPENLNSELPTVFSLSHPLDEICPIVAKNDILSYISNPDMRIVFTSESPSLCLTYDSKMNLHSLYLIRKAQPQESEICVQRETMLSRATSFSSKLGQSATNSFNFGAETNRNHPTFLSARTRKSLGLPHSTAPPSSPMSTTYERTSSPLPSSRSAVLAGLSPAFSATYHTPSPRARHDSFLNSPSRIEHRMLSEDVEYADARPLYPQVCVSAVWVEPGSSIEETCGPCMASKAFLTTDLSDQMYLCYLVKSKLFFIEIFLDNDEHFTVGELFQISAKDAISLTPQKMLAVISLDGGVELFTGTIHVSKIFISGVASSLATSSYLSDITSGATFFAKPSPGSFPKRSSLIMHTNPLESPVFGDSLSQFSPVSSYAGLSPLNPSICPQKGEGTVLGLRDSIAGGVSLEYTSSQIFRMEIPSFGHSPLVASCLQVLQHILSKKLSLQFTIKWYTLRNAPGCSNVSLEEEFRMFTKHLFSSLGYDVALLRGNKVEPSPEMKAKKQRKSDVYSEDDWTFLLNSGHHELHSSLFSASDHIFSAASTLPKSSTLVPQDQSMPTAITETPLLVPSRGGSQSFEISTPVVAEKSLKARSARNTKSLESLEETPVQTVFGKSRQPHFSRFQKSLEQDMSPITEVGESKWPLKSTVLISNTKAPLFGEIVNVLLALHLLYEELKLNSLRTNELPLLVEVLYQLATDLGAHDYVHHYWTDFPFQCALTGNNSTQNSNLANPPHIFSFLRDIISCKDINAPYPFMGDLNKRSKDLIKIFGMMAFGTDNLQDLFLRLLYSFGKVGNTEVLPMEKQKKTAHSVLLMMSAMGITPEIIRTYPPGVAFVIHEAIYECRDDPGLGWPKKAYKLAERRDLASLYRSQGDSEIGPTNKLVLPKRKSNSELSAYETTEDDGMEDLVEADIGKLRWPKDQRVLEVRRMLQSAHPVRINIQQRPDVSDHEFVQEQERHLYALCWRTMALPVGRGMVTLRSASPVITEKLPIPQLCLTGRVPPSDKLVDMSHIEVAINLNVWPLFHNGVAAGLRISPNAPDIDSQWIIYNKPKANNDELFEHAGFLMALGLNGHLKNRMDLNIYMYLVKGQEMTRVGLLLGVAVSKRGTMDVHTVKMVSVHIEAMLPPTGIELEVDVVVEPAALMALGFLYQGTAHRHVAQVLLQEIGRPPGPEMENSVDRESYSLAAGLALGLVVFGKGNKLSGLSDMTIPDTLHHFMVGGPQRPYMGSQREKYKTSSFLIWEGPLVNTHVTGPGATLALGMLYFATGNKAVADWLKVPETQHLLENVLPDALLLRTLAKCLILWDEIEPCPNFIQSHVPEFVLKYALSKPQPCHENGVDYETMNEAYCNIVAGACMAVGLRFAGSADENAFNALWHFAHQFVNLLGRSIAELCGRVTIETCLNVITISLAMVMAGTGDLEVLKICRFLRSRVGPNNTVVTYGSHLATHMAIGLLFLGGGTLTLSTSPDAIAALLCAFYPKWPISSCDNRYHLQALRHLYVLAVEPRLLQPRDIDTRSLCYAHIQYIYIDSPELGYLSGQIISSKAPCILPELNKLKEVRINDSRYWTIRFTEDKNWEDFKKILAGGSFIDVMKKAGCLSYIDDPMGFRSLLAQTLTSNDVVSWNVPLTSLFTFSSDPVLENFLNLFLDPKELDGTGDEERRILETIADLTYHCLTKDKLSLAPIWLTLLKFLRTLRSNPNVQMVWQWKLMWSRLEHASYKLIPPELALSMKQSILNILASWQPGIEVLVKDYLRRSTSRLTADDPKLLTYLTFHDFPSRDSSAILSLMQSENKMSILPKLLDAGVSAAAALVLINSCES